MNATVTPHEYVQAKGWDLMCIAVSADDLSDEDAQNADKYVEGGADALRDYCQRRVREIVEYGVIRLRHHVSNAIWGLCAVTLPGRFEGLGDTLSL